MRAAVLRGLLAFEWRFHTRQLSFAAAVAVLSLASLALVGTGYGPRELAINSPYVVTQSVGLLSLLAVFPLMVFCANAALRETEHRMSEIVFATPIGKWTFLLSRYAGALMAACTAYGIAMLVLLIAPLVIAVDPERLAPVRVASYAWAALVVLLPNLLLMSALLFAVALRTRSSFATYVGGMSIYAMYLLGSALGNSPLMAQSVAPSDQALARAALIDPIGFSAFFEQTRYWTVAERGTQLLALDGHFLLNRLLWLAVSAGVITLAGASFSLRTAARVKAKKGRSIESLPATTTVATRYRIVAPGESSTRVSIAAFWSTTRLDLRHALGSRPAIALMLIWMGILAVEISGATGDAEYATQLYPTTSLLLGAIVQPFALLGVIAVIFIGTELVWRARASAMDEILGATPASGAVFYLARLFSLIALIATMTFIAIGLGLLYQVANGYSGGHRSIFLSLFATSALPLVLYAVLVLLVQSLSPNRYLGMLVSLALVVLLRQSALLGIEHSLLRYAALPTLEYSELSGFGDDVRSFRWLGAYWSAVALVLAAVTVGVWRRGRESGVLARIRTLPRTLGRLGTATAGVGLAGAAALGGAVFVDTNIQNAYETRAANERWRSDYERTYGGRARTASPAIIGLTSHVALYPSAGRLDAEGSYRLENRGNVPIDTVWIAVRRDLTLSALRVNGAGADIADTRFGMYGFITTGKLGPGQHAEATFRVGRQRGAISADGSEALVAANGSFISNETIFPTIGYREGYTFRDPATRRRLGLPVEPPRARESLAWMTFELTVSTDADQIAVAPGTLLREWSAGGRRFFQYKRESPMPNRFAVASGRYAVRRGMQDGVSVEVYFHPTHGQNVDRMLEATKRSLALFSESFTPYPYGQLRIVEVPLTFGGGAAVAYPELIGFAEDRGFLTDARDSSDIDLVTRRTAHEVAHQWWGLHLAPPNEPGASMLVESLAKYSEQRVIAGVQDEARVNAILAFDHDRYLLGRAGEESVEPPLAQVTNESWLYYGKGGVVMSALRDLVGEGSLERALKRLLMEKSGADSATRAQDLITLLKAESPARHHALIDEWLTKATMYDLAVRGASAERLADGRYRVTAEIAASKSMRHGSDEVTTSIDEQIDIVVYGARTGVSSDSVLHVGRERLGKRSTLVSIVVDRRPSSIAVDPFIRRIDRERANNARGITHADGRE